MQVGIIFDKSLEEAHFCNMYAKVAAAPYGTRCVALLKSSLAARSCAT